MFFLFCFCCFSFSENYRFCRTVEHSAETKMVSSFVDCVQMAYYTAWTTAMRFQELNVWNFKVKHCRLLHTVLYGWLLKNNRRAIGKPLEMFVKASDYQTSPTYFKRTCTYTLCTFVAATCRQLAATVAHDRPGYGLKHCLDCVIICQSVQMAHSAPRAAFC